MQLNTNIFPAGNSGVGGTAPGRPPEARLSPENDRFFKQQDKITLSQEGKDQAASRSDSSYQNSRSRAEQNLEAPDKQELAQLQQLKHRDIEVRTHEQAHLSAAGLYAKGGASFTLQKGIDGKSYAVAGEVGIDVGKESTPEATITKMQTIKRAALAPANPSGADRRIASQATVKESEARKELLLSRQQELIQGGSVDNPLAEKQKSTINSASVIASPSIGSLKTKLATYAKMAAA
jgi:hypothetical protein